jgi:multidrug resistance efflux pump
MSVSIDLRVKRLIVAGLLACAPALGCTETIWFTGELQALQSEPIIVPPSNSSPVVLRYLAPEGSLVEPGEVLVRIDPGNSATQVRQLESQLLILEATAARDIAALEVAAADAEKALIDARAALAKSRIDAGIPRQHLSALDFDRYQGELQRAEREYALKQEEFIAASAAITRKHHDAGLEADKLRADLVWHRSQVENAEQRAETRGRVVYGFDAWRGNRYEEGASAYPGNKVGEGVGVGGFEVRAHLLETERAGLALQQAVTLHLDAFPGRMLGGRIVRISGAPESRAQWGDGRYFSVDIELAEAAPDGALPGMSLRVEARGDGA